MSDRPAETLRPATVLGIELGIFKWSRVFIFDALYNLNRSQSSGFAEFNPKSVFVSIGKKATSQTHINNAK